MHLHSPTDDQCSCNDSCVMRGRTGGNEPSCWSVDSKKTMVRQTKKGNHNCLKRALHGCNIPEIFYTGSKYAVKPQFFMVFLKLYFIFP